MSGSPRHNPAAAGTSAALETIRAERLARLSRADLGQVRLLRLADLSTMGVGGPAVVLETPDSERLAAYLRLASSLGWESVIAGHGSNVLFPDEGLAAVVVRLVGDLARIEAPAAAAVSSGVGAPEAAAVSSGADAPAAAAEPSEPALSSGAAAPAGVTLSCGAGAPLARVVAAACEAGLSGLEFAAGIPGTVGGAVRGNAGAAGGDMAMVLASADLLTAEGRLETMAAEDLKAGYRSLAAPAGFSGAVITRASLRLTPSSPDIVRAAAAERVAQRAAGQPKGRSLGCVFLNPPGDYAGRLIEAAGLKGRRLGGALVSGAHANFIINEGGATAADIRALISEIRGGVLKASGIRLQLEIKVMDPHGHLIDNFDGEGGTCAV